MSTTSTESKAKADYKVADIKLAEWGRKEISIAEKEMPGRPRVALEALDRA